MTTVILYQSSRDAQLTTVENARKPVAKATLTRREAASAMLAAAVRRADVKLAEMGDHGQISRQIADKEHLSFHHMVAAWPDSVMRELTLQMALHYGFEVVQSVRTKESA